jgi:hypothetical protein
MRYPFQDIRKIMAVNGTYSIVIDTPMGQQQAALALKTDGNTLTGTADTAMGKADFTGTANGNDIAWKITINSPMGKLKLEFTGQISGDDIFGRAKAGNFGCFPFKGKKI